MASVTMTKDTHEAAIEDGIVLIDFWAAWCGPCRAFAPVFEAASEAHPDVTFAKVDTDVERELAGMYGISSIPTLVIYRDGIPVFMQPGAMGAPQLEELLGQVRALDMETVRTQYEAQLKAAGRA
jgi:thioredoxin 1